MKINKIKILIFSIALFVVFGISSFVYAVSVIFTSTGITTNSVTLNLSKAKSGDLYFLRLLKNQTIKDPNTPNYDSIKPVIIDSSGNGSASFTGLVSSGKYTGIYLLDTGITPDWNSTEAIYITTLPSSTLTETLSLVEVYTSDITENSVRVHVDGANAGDSYTVKISSVDDSSYNKEQTTPIDSSGSGYLIFSGLTAGSNYNISYKKDDNSNPNNWANTTVPLKTTGTKPAVVKKDQGANGNDNNFVNNNTQKNYEGLVPKCNTGEIDKVTGQYANPCDFTYFMELINNVIKFLLFTIATPLIALIIVYIAYLFLTSGGSSEKITKAKHIFFNAVIGYVIALAAWLIINTILSALGVDSSIGSMFLKK